MQTLLLITRSYQNYSWPESPIKINIPKLLSWSDQNYSRYRNYSWSECKTFLITRSYQNYVQTLLLISIPDTEITPDRVLTPDYRVRSKVLQTRVSNTSISHEITPDQSFWCKTYSWLHSYQNYAWPESPIISPDQRSRYRNYSWSEFLLSWSDVSGANLLLQNLLLITRSYQNYSWPESPINIFLSIWYRN